MLMQLSLIAVDWGPNPWTYTLIWAAWVAACLLVLAAKRLWRAQESSGKISAAIAVCMAALFAGLACDRLQLIYRFATWPAFSYRTFLLFGAPIYVPAIVVAAVARHSDRASLIAAATRGALWFGMPMFVVAASLGYWRTNVWVNAGAPASQLRHFWMTVLPGMLVALASIGAMAGVLVSMIRGRLSGRGN